MADAVGRVLPRRYFDGSRISPEVMRVAVHTGSKAR
jgi:hypothetical protein